MLCNGPDSPKSALPLPTGTSAPHLIHGSLGSPNSTSQTASRSVQPSLHSSRQCRYILQWLPLFPPYNCPFLWGIWTPIQHTIPWAHPSPQPKRHLDSFSRFCTDDHRVSLYFTMGYPFPLKIANSHGDVDPHVIHGSLGPPSLNPNHISIASAVFAGLTIVTDHATWLVTIESTYVVRAMQPKNTELNTY